jgi:hypothetical protein
MAELADAADSKSADLRVLGVRLPLPAPAQINEKQWFTRLDAAAVYKVDTDAIALKVKKEFVAKDSLKKTPKAVSKAKKAA